MYIHIYHIYNICTYVCTDYVKHMSLPRTPSHSKEFELQVLSVSLSHSPLLARAHPLSMLQCHVSLSLQFLLVFSLLFTPIYACPSLSLSLALTVEVATVVATRNTTKATRHTTNPPLCNQNGDLFVQLTHPTKRKSPYVSTYLLASRAAHLLQILLQFPTDHLDQHTWVWWMAVFIIVRNTLTAQ